MNQSIIKRFQQPAITMFHLRVSVSASILEKCHLDTSIQLYFLMVYEIKCSSFSFISNLIIVACIKPGSKKV